MDSIILPKIQLNIGTNTISINTSISPTSFSIRYNKTQVGTIEEEITTDEYFENKPNDEIKPISAITLRSSEIKAAGQTIYDDNLIEQYGVNELIIEEDYIAYTDTLRNAYLEAAKELFGLTYKPLTIDVLGNIYLDFNDVIKVINPQGEEYITYSLNNNHEYNGTLYNTLTVPALTEAEEKYKYEPEDKTFRRKTAAEIDKANGRISLINQQIGDRSQKEATITEEIDQIELKISDIEDLTLEVTGNNPITLENCLKGVLLQLRIKGNNTVFDGLKPSDTLVPSNTLTPKGDSILLIKHYDENNELISIDEYDLQITEPLRQYSSTVYDEFVYDYEDENQKAYVIRRVGVTENGTLYNLVNEIIEPVDIENILLTKGKNIIDIGLPYIANCYARYVQITEFTKQFATTYEVESAITQLANSITLLVREKVGKNEVIAEINAAVREGQGIITITGNQVIIHSDYFNLSANGTIEAKKGMIGYWTLEDRSLYAIAEDEGTGNEYQAGMFATSDASFPFFYAGKEPNSPTYTANFTVSPKGYVKAKYIDLNGESGYTKINFDSGRLAMGLTKNQIEFRLDDNANNLFARITREQNDFTIAILGALGFRFYDQLHDRNLYNISPLYFDGSKPQHWFTGRMVCDKNADGSWVEVALKSDLSDSKVKKDIKDSTTNALEIIDKLKFKQFTWDKTVPNAGKHVNIGIIAQDLQDIDENYIDYTTRIYEEKEEQLLSINILNLLTTTTKAVQELSQKVKELEEEIRKLKGAN